jgi:hypothetical protein
MEEKMGLISFDFDDTLTIKVPGTRALPNWGMIRLLRQYARAGHLVVIVTYRCKENESRDWLALNEPYRVVIDEFVEEHDLPVGFIHYTNHTDKGPVLALMGASAHYDDDRVAVASTERFGVKGVLVTPGEDVEWEPLQDL